MHKRKLQHIHTRLHYVPSWLLLSATAGAGVLSVAALRQNNLQMVKLRDAVYTADKEDRDTETALQNLRSYVYGHMNTDLSSSNGIKPPIQLQGRYDRLVAAETARVKAANDKIYTEATSICEQRHPQGQITQRASCVEQYVQDRGISANSIAQDQYKFDFVSPGWSPDLAGWSIVLTVLLAFLTVTRIVIDRWLKHRLHEHL